MTRWRIIAFGVLLAVAVAGILWLMSRPAVLPLADSKQDTMADMPGMESKKGEASGVRREGLGAKEETGPLTPHASRPKPAWSRFRSTGCKRLG